MAKRSFLQSVGDALAGVAATWRTQRSFRIQAALAAALAVVLAYLRPPLVFSALCMAMAMLFLAAELFNTAFEKLADHLHPEHHPAIGAAKDCAAGAVLLGCAGAGFVGMLTLLSFLRDGSPPCSASDAAFAVPRTVVRYSFVFMPRAMCRSARA